MSVYNFFPNNNILWSIRALDISGNYGQRIDLSSNNTINFNTSSTNRLRITDASSIFLNSVDLSANNLLNVNNLTVSRARPQTDASYNFTVVRISTDASARDIAIPSPYNGQLCFILTNNNLQYYNNGSWSILAGSQTLNQVTIAGIISGLTETTYLDSNSNSIPSPVSNGYTVIKLTCGSNTTNATFNLTPSTTISVTFLLVGGGGSSSSSNGGGGGGGGVISNIINLTGQVGYPVQVGAGGIGTSSNGSLNNLGNNGNDTTAFGFTAGGGGCGGVYTGNPVGIVGQNGRATNGSGGGAPYQNLAGGLGNGSGGNGASSVAGAYNGGGGGAGGSATNQNGGPGVASNILGTTYYFGGGGGATALVPGNNAGNGGIGGGGGGSSTTGANGTGGGSALNSGANGNSTNSIGGNGGKDTGGGAGGSGNQQSGNANSTGANGGSGIIVIRFASYS